MRQLFHDVRYSIRTLARQRAFTVAAVLTLSLGIGANTALFTVVDALLLRPLPVRDGDRLMMLATKDRHMEFPHLLSYQDYRDYKDCDAFDDAISYRPAPANLSGEGALERIRVELVSGNYFTMLGVNPLLGRTIVPDDDRAPGGGPVVVLTYGFWERRFGSDPRIVGKTVRLNARAFEVIGVAPKTFSGTEPVLAMDAYVPISMLEEIMPGRGGQLEQRDAHSFRVLARLKSGVRVSQASAAVTTMARHLAEQYPDTNKDVQVLVIPETRARPDPAAAAFLPSVASALMAMVMLVLLVAGANTAHLMVARGVARQKEIAVRAALGASRRRLVQESLTESLVIALAGGAAGFVVALFVTSWLSRIPLPAGVPVHYDLRTDWRVFGFVFAATAATGLLVGLAPAFNALRAHSVDLLKSGGRNTAGSTRQRLHATLLVSQIAVCVVLLISTGLFVQSLQNAWQIDLGFHPEKTLLLSVDPGLQAYDEARSGEFHDQLLTRVRALPGVRAVSSARYVPLGLETGFMNVLTDRQAAVPKAESASVVVNMISPEYFGTLGIPLVRGRDFTQHDDQSARAVSIVSQAFARRFWPGEDPLGRQLRIGDTDARAVVVIGVVGDVKWVLVNEQPRPLLYLPVRQRYVSARTLHIAVAGDPSLVAAAARREVAALDPDLPTYGVTPMSTQVYEGPALLAPRLGAAMVGACGLMSLVLAMVGLYGLVSYSVARRLHEIGVRMALGATRGNLLRLVVGRAMTLTLVGLTIGLLLSLAMGRFLSTMLYGVSPQDPAVFSLVTVVLAIVALVASGIPGRRAVSSDPTQALRSE